MSVETCALKLKEQYPFMEEGELNSLAQYMQEIREVNPDRSQVMRYVREFIEDQNLEQTVKTTAKLHTIGQHAVLLDRLDNMKWNGDYLQAALSVFEETTSNVMDAGQSIEKTRQHKMIGYHSLVNDNLNRIGLDNDFHSAAFDGEIINALAGKDVNLTGAAKGSVDNMANVLRKAYASIHKDLRAAGIHVAYRPDYDGPVVHDGSAINGNFSSWVKSIDNAIDLVAEFKTISAAQYAEFKQAINSGTMDLDNNNKLTQILRATYDKISTEDSMLRGEQSQLTGSRGAMETFAERRSRPKTFTKWKSGEAKQAYLNEFGKYKTLSERFDFYSRQAGRDVGLASNLGADPRRGFDMLRKATEDRLVASGVNRTEINEKLRQLDIAYTNAAVLKAPATGIASRFAISLRQLAATAKLGSSGLTSAALDPVSSAAQARDLFGEGMISSVFRTYRNYIPAMWDAATKSDLGDMYLFQKHEVLTSLEELYTMGGNVAMGDKVSKMLYLASDMVNKGSLGYFFNKVSHITNARMYTEFLSKDLANGKATPAMMASLQKYGITPEDTAILAKIGVNKNDGMKNIFGLTASEFSELSGVSNILDAADELSGFQDRMNGWLLERIKTGAPIPGARERRILHGDTRAGTMEGEARRYLSQFKSTALKVFMDSTYGSIRRSNMDLEFQANQDFSELFKDKTSMASMARLSAHMTIAGVGLMATRAALNSDERFLDRVNENDPTLVLEAFLSGGGSFFLGDIISFTDRPTESLSKLATPAIAAPIRLLYEGGNFIHGAGTGQEGKMLFHGINAAKTYTPGANFWFMQPFISGMSEYAREQRKQEGREKRSRRSSNGVINL